MVEHMSEKDVDTLLDKHGLATWGDLTEKLKRLRRNGYLGTPAQEPVGIEKVDIAKPVKRMGRPPKVRE